MKKAKKIRPFVNLSLSSSISARPPEINAWKYDEKKSLNKEFHISGSSNNNNNNNNNNNGNNSDETNYGVLKRESEEVLHLNSKAKSHQEQKDDRNYLDSAINTLNCKGGNTCACPWRLPWMIIMCSLIQISLFYYGNKEIYKTLLYTPFRKREVWRFLTYMFLHSDQIHLILNILLQIFTAFPLELEQGHFKTILIYISGGLAGSLGTSIFQSSLLMVGSSAGVYSLLLSHISHIIMNFQSLSLKYFRIIAVIILCLSDICFTTTHIIVRKNIDPQISVSAHLSGAISGLILGFILYSSSSSSSSHGEETTKRRCRHIFIRICKLFSVILYSILLTAALFITFNCRLN